MSNNKDTKLSIIIVSLLLLAFLGAAVLVDISSKPSPQVTPTQSTPDAVSSVVIVSPTPAAAIQAPTPFSLQPGDSPVIISEVLAGITGNNNNEFIELYNRSQGVVDLQGWALWYRLPTSTEDLFIYRWTSSALIPPQGHYLLGFTGQDIGLPVNAEYEQALNITAGGIQLRSTDGSLLDSLGWGEAPENFYEGTPAPEMQNGIALERAPGGEEGNFTDTHNNYADFSLQTLPNPQNTGSQIVPANQACLSIDLIAPQTSEPGSQFEATLSISNPSAQSLTDITAILPIPAPLAVEDVYFSSEPPNQITITDNTVTWQIQQLAAGETQTANLVIDVPYTYFTALFSNYYAQASGCPLPAFGAPAVIQIEGGTVPIGVARTLDGSDLTIEGIATMYTGGYYAGTGNVKFYLADETGAIQVQVFGGQGSVNVSIGARVRVRGEVDIYRGAIEIVPIVVPDDVEIINPPGDVVAEPLLVSIEDASTELYNLPGKLVQVEGEVIRVEEFSYSYELDLLSDSDQVLTLYVDKQTEINVEEIELGQLYRAIGILEVRDGHQQLYPRLQSDLQRIYPPSLLLDAEASHSSIQPGDAYECTVAAFNYTDQTLTNIVITATLPRAGVSWGELQDGGEQTIDEAAVWHIAELPPDGGSAVVHFSVVISEPTDPGTAIVIDNITATAAEWSEPAIAPPIRTFVGDSVPIWAIQGDSTRSPYLFERLVTAGVVTGVFPDLGGFFIQETLTDDNPSTSSGLFITGDALELTLLPGDLVQVEGIVREPSSQTTLIVDEPVNIVVLSQANPLPSPQELVPPATTAEANPYYESLEGMLVQVTRSAVAVAPTTKYGEYVIVLPEYAAEGQLTHIYQGEDNGFAIVVDDGTNLTHSDNTTLPYTVATGDIVNNLVGPLAYTYGQYKIEPISSPLISASDFRPTPLQPASEDEFNIMTWNVENLFDTRAPHPSDPPLPSRAEYDRDIEKVANTILAAGTPIVIALQEVENINILQDICDHELLSYYGYQPILEEGTDSRGIDVGYLVRGDRASVIDVQQRPAPEGLTSRPPLILHVEITTSSGTANVYLINNHFLSMSGGELATEPTRTAQAAWNVALVEELLAQNPDAHVAILGDLNSYYASLPIETLRDGGLIHVMDVLSPEERYTYIYQGQAQVLDHILITPALNDFLSRVVILHVNADFPFADPADTSPQHKSDHDPLIATFDMSN